MNVVGKLLLMCIVLSTVLTTNQVGREATDLVSATVITTSIGMSNQGRRSKSVRILTPPSPCQVPLFGVGFFFDTSGLCSFLSFFVCVFVCMYVYRPLNVVCLCEFGASQPPHTQTQTNKHRQPDTPSVSLVLSRTRATNPLWFISISISISNNHNCKVSSHVHVQVYLLLSCPP